MDLNIYDTPDPFYRYKMPAIRTRFERRATVITNLEEIAKSLSRPTDLIIAFLSITLGCGKTTNKLMGHHEEAELQGLLRNFVDRFVICGMCKNPETSISSRKQHIRITCKACGYDTDIKSSEAIHRYIMKSELRK